MSTLTPKVLRKLEEHFSQNEIEGMDMRQLVQRAIAQGTVADADIIQGLVQRNQYAGTSRNTRRNSQLIA